MRRPFVKATLAVLAIAGGLAVSHAALAEDKYVIDFETKFGYVSAGGTATSKEGMVITGTKSFLCDSTKSKEEWNERLWGDVKKAALEPLASYTIDFDYRILEPEGDGGSFYFFLRRNSPEWAGHDVGWLEWKSADGDEGHKTVNVTLGDFPDYRFVFGMHFTGKMVIDNIVITKD